MIRLLTGDVRDMLATLPDASVQTVVTSPPYYGLRDYGVAGQLGLEATPDEYLATMVQVFREVRRVLRDDGTCWVNMGDSYATSPAGNLQPSDAKRGPASYRRANNAMDTTRIAKPKDLLMMPARLALALQADGWWLRSDIIWAKPNPMPESVTDRPTSAHEHVFLLTKHSRYFYDADAVREGISDSTIERWGNGGTSRKSPGTAPERNDTDAEYYGERSCGFQMSGRNLRNVWTIATAPYSDCHFATFPPTLAERCIRAGTSERGCCAQCGKPWVRVTDTERVRHPQPPGKGKGQHMVPGAEVSPSSCFRTGLVPITTTTGWSPGCQCNAAVAPCVVLDCFSGAGTALLVADRLGRDAIGIDLSHAYVEMARERLQADCPLFADINDAPVPEPPEDERMADLFADAEYAQLPPKPMRVPAGWDTGPGAHGSIHRTGRTLPEAAE